MAAAQNTFRRGILPIILLSLLKSGDMYGYQLVQETIRRSGGRIITQEGSLYPVLYKLLELGYISDYKVKVGKRMVRVYYRLEPTGRTYLDELIEDYRSIVDGVSMILEENINGSN